jgi:hypothetical protein
MSDSDDEDLSTGSEEIERANKVIFSLENFDAWLMMGQGVRLPNFQKSRFGSYVFSLSTWRPLSKSLLASSHAFKVLHAESLDESTRGAIWSMFEANMRTM